MINCYSIPPFSMFSLWELAEKNHQFLLACEKPFNAEIIIALIKRSEVEIALKHERNSRTGSIFEEELKLKVINSTFRIENLIEKGKIGNDESAFYRLNSFVGFVSAHLEKMNPGSAAFRSLCQELYADIENCASRLDYPFPEKNFELYSAALFLRPMSQEIEEAGIRERARKINSQYSSLDPCFGALIAHLQKDYLEFLCSSKFKPVEAWARDGSEPENIDSGSLLRRRNYYAQDRKRRWFPVFEIIEQNHCFLQSGPKELIAEAGGIILSEEKKLKEKRPKECISLYAVTAFVNFIKENHPIMEKIPPELRTRILSDAFQENFRMASMRDYASPDYVRARSAEEDLGLFQKYSWDENLCLQLLNYPFRSRLSPILDDFISKAAAREDHQLGKTRMILKILAEHGLNRDEEEVCTLREIYTDFYSRFNTEEEIKSGLALFGMLNQKLGSPHEKPRKKQEELRQIYKNLFVQLTAVDYKKHFSSDLTAFEFLIDKYRTKGLEEIRNISELIRLGYCQTLEEVVECAEMNLRLKGTGYEVVKKIGPGTYKEVYLAKDRFGRRGALKRIDPEAEAAVREKGLSLDEMLSKDLTISPFDLKHPNVCSTLPICTPQETFILEELYELTLEDLLKQMHSSGKFAARSVEVTTPEMERRVIRPLYQLSSDAPMTSPEYLKSLSKMKNGPTTTTLLFPYSELILDLVTQLVSGLRACHQKGIIHADLKTNNIGIKKDLTAVLSDFGMATLDQGIRARKDPCSIYIRDIKLLEPKSRPDWQSDYWAVGSILYRLCTGRFPFSQEPAIFSPEEREEYIQTMQEAYSQGNWREALQENIKKFLPEGFEIGNFILDGRREIVGKDVFLEPNLEIMGKIKTFLEMCFRLSGKDITFSPSFMESNLSGINSELEHLKMEQWRQTVKVHSLDKVRKYFEEAGRTEIVQKDFPFKYRILCTTKEVYQD